MNHIFSLEENTPEKGNLFLGGVSVINDIESIKEKHIPNDKFWKELIHWEEYVKKEKPR